MTRARRTVLGATALLTVLSVPATALASSPASAAKAKATTSPGCKTGAVPDEVKGKPAITRGDASGEYVGHDAHGWSLFVTHPLVLGTDGKPVAKGQTKVVFAGRITSTKPMHYTPRRLEKHDQVFISRDRRTILYRFNNYGGLDGLRFVADCSAKVTFTVRTDKALSPVSDIYLGSGKVHPATNPFSEVRVKATPTPSPSPTASASPSPSAAASTSA